MTRGQKIKKSKDIELFKDLIRYSCNNQIIELLISNKNENPTENSKNKLKILKLLKENNKSFFRVRA